MDTRDAAAAYDEAEHAYENARRSGCPMALFNAHNRRAQAKNNLMAARAEAMTPAERAAAEWDHQNAGPTPHL